MQKKNRKVIYSFYFFLLVILTISVWTNDNFTDTQTARLFGLISYVTLAFVIVLLGEWLNANQKDSPRRRKIFFRSLLIIWLICLFPFFGDIF